MNAPVRTYRVVQFATGHAGRHTLRQIVESPLLELVGVHAYSADKIGRDAAELCGLDAPTGVRATEDVDALVALRPDVVVYTAQGETRPAEAQAELVRFLEAGIDVVSTALVWLVHPPSADEWIRGPLAAACERGGSTLYVNGIDPGFVADTLPLTALSLCQSVSKVHVQEIFDYSSYDDPDFTGVAFGFGNAPDDEPPLLLQPGVLSMAWGASVHGLADALGVQVDEIREGHEVAYAEQTIECAMGRIEAGHVAGVRFWVEGLVDGEPLVVHEHVNRLGDDVGRDWPYPPVGRSGVHRVVVSGYPGVELNAHVGLDGVDHNEGGIVATGARVVNAIPAVVDAAPGLVSALDLPIGQARGLLRGRGTVTG